MLERLKAETLHDERYLFAMVFALFLPFYMTAIIYGLMALRLLLTHELQDAFKKTPGHTSVLIFCLLEMIISVIYQNWIGAGISIGILMLFSLIFYYRQHVTKAYFEIMLSIIMYMSVFAALYALVEYIGILNKFNINQLEIIVFNTPKNRINSMFFNANYYAMMINFFVAITFYKIINLLQKEFTFYSLQKLIEMVVIIALNLFCLYLTGCRTAWPSLLAGIVVMLFISGHYKSFSILVSGFIGICIYFGYNPEKIPRIDNVLKYLQVRQSIWNVAIQNFMSHPLFGEGPMTYWHVYPQYPMAHPTQHAHNIFIDPLCSYGIIGILSIVPYFISVFKRIIQLYKIPHTRNIIALISGFIVMTIIHGLLDLTIFFVPTGFLFLLIINSFDIYKDVL